MKKVLLFMMFIPVSLWGQVETDSENILTDVAGKWEETARFKKKKSIEFSDTLRMEIREDSYMMMRFHLGPTLLGNALRKKDEIVFKNRTLEIESVSNNEFRFSDDAGIHVMKKVTEFSEAPIHKKIPGLEEEKKAGIYQQEMLGKWTCYKKTDPEYTPAKFYLKQLQVKQKTSSDLYNGTITMHNADSVYTNDCLIEIEKKQVKIRMTGGAMMMLETEMLMDNEWVLLENKTRYYLKMLTK
ncbi:MAG: hypothetical protein KBF25_00660 [Chitinophagaceae bacterium]|jgi:hypothetical protein|nr:hypothetical protein [Chitinophagaceae bacterium]